MFMPGALEIGGILIKHMIIAIEIHKTVGVIDPSR